MEFEQKLQQLTELGFDGETARTALRRACGDLEVAASRLLGENETPAEAPPQELSKETDQQKPQQSQPRPTKSDSEKKCRKHFVRSSKM